VAFERLAAGKEFRGDPARWLRGTIRNLVYAWWRRKRKMPQDVADRLKRLADEVDDPLAALAKDEVKAALDHCLGKLHADDRRLVVKRYGQGLRIADIAAQLRKNAVTVRVRLFRIRQSLKRCVEAQLSGSSAT